MHRVDPNKLPRHVAIIMDGNGRWAKKNLKNRILGHQEGGHSVLEVVRCCHDLGISHLTLYTFSKENWQRPKREVFALWRLLKAFLKTHLPELIERRIRLLHIGDLDHIPEDVVRTIEHCMERTASHDELRLTLAVNYGSRQEIVRAAQLFAVDVRDGKREPSDLTPELLARYLFAPDLPDPDLLIRTSGECRISNFLLWQLAYTEIYVTEVLWPEFRKPQFIEALLDYQRRERRFGKTSEQLTAAR